MNTLPKQNDKDIHTQFFSSTKPPGLDCHITSAVLQYFCFVKISLPLASCVRFFGKYHFWINALMVDGIPFFYVYRRLNKCLWVAFLFFILFFLFFLALYQEEKGKIPDIYWVEDAIFSSYWCNRINRMSGTSRVGLLKTKNVYANLGLFKEHVISNLRFCSHW